MADGHLLYGADGHLLYNASGHMVNECAAACPTDCDACADTYLATWPQLWAGWCACPPFPGPTWTGIYICAGSATLTRNANLSGCGVGLLGQCGWGIEQTGLLKVRVCMTSTSCRSPAPDPSTCTLLSSCGGSMDTFLGCVYVTCTLVGGVPKWRLRLYEPAPANPCVTPSSVDVFDYKLASACPTGTYDSGVVVS